TPSGVASVTIGNASSTRDAVYAMGATAPLNVNGDFALYLGWTVLHNGIVLEPETLADLTTNITFNFTSTSSDATQVLIDGNLDPAGASYSISGSNNLFFRNNTVGLAVAINGYRSQDRVSIGLPGGSIDANLTRTGPGIL